MLTEHAGIDLAREKPFRLGPVSVRPAVRELARDPDAREILEPRVMQVLVALARAGGEVLTRDDLTLCCWEGRIVGEDAINRVISRLRRSADGIGRGAFRIETVNKVGYRLVVAEGASPAAAPEAAVRPASSRRALLVGGGAAVLAAAGSGAAVLALRRAPRPALDSMTAAAYDHGWTALRNTGSDQVAQAVGLFRAVVAAAPGYADGWGALAYAYSIASKQGDPSRQQAMAAGCRSAAARALQLNPRNALAEAALADMTPILGHWLAQEPTLRAALLRHPDTTPLMRELEWLLLSVGRARDAV